MGQILKTPQDLRYLSWSKIRGSSGTAGSFLKAQEDTSQGRIYYKLSHYDVVDGIMGHESVNEIIADRLLEILGIPHVPYQLIHADVNIDGKIYRTWLCASRDFKQRGEAKIALDAFYELNRQEGESPLEFCVRQGWSEYIYQMLLVDYIILNRDRHGANMEVLMKRGQSIRQARLAPLFDHGVSLFCRSLNEEAMEKEDVLADKQVQCFVGSRSAWQNVKLIPKENLPAVNPLKETDREYLLADLEEAIGGRWLERIWEMIWKRWCSYEDFCHQK